MIYSDFIGVFDSGAGGLTVLNECKKALPHESFVFLADNRHMPYGNRSQEEIVRLTLDACAPLCEGGIKALVIACNTATASSVSQLRTLYSIPVLGIEPAIKPASLAFPNQKILLLCSQATAQQAKFVELIFKYRSNKTIILPQNGLAHRIEQSLGNLSALEEDIAAILSPHHDARAIVLGCTHYEFIAPLIEDYYQSIHCPISIFGGNKGVAHHLKEVLFEQNLLSPSTQKGKTQILTTKCGVKKKYLQALKGLMLK